MESGLPQVSPQPTAPDNQVAAYCRWLRDFFSDRRVSISGLLMFAYAAGIVSAFYIRDSHPVAVIHPGPYALVAIYKGNVYELIPMEDSAHFHRLHGDPLKRENQSEMEKVGEMEPNAPPSGRTGEGNRPNAPYRTRY